MQILGDKGHAEGQQRGGGDASLPDLWRHEMVAQRRGVEKLRRSTLHGVGGAYRGGRVDPCRRVMPWRWSGITKADETKDMHWQSILGSCTTKAGRASESCLGGGSEAADQGDAPRSQSRDHVPEGRGGPQSDALAVSGTGAQTKEMQSAVQSWG